jgi:hypothetical protein
VRTRRSVSRAARRPPPLDRPPGPPRSAAPSSASDEDTLEACQYLAKTTDHPKVRSAVDRLKASSGSAIDVLTRDVNEWVALARATYRLDCEAMTKMWVAYCELDWEPEEDTDEPGRRPGEHRQPPQVGRAHPLVTAPRI